MVLLPRSLRLIRWASPADVPTLVRCMQEARTGCSWLTYGDMDGYALVDDADERVRGYVRFMPGRPETWIRQLVVHPDFAGNGRVARRLLLGVADASMRYGAQVIEGFVHHDNAVVLDQLQRLGAVEDAGVRVRVPLTTATRFA